MFRVEKEFDEQRTRLTISGEISSECAELVESCCQQAISDGKAVDLVLDITNIDESGRALLGRFDGRGWMTAEEDLWDIPDYLANVRHFPLVTSAQVRALATVDRRMFAAGLVGRESGNGR